MEIEALAFEIAVVLGQSRLEKEVYQDLRVDDILILDQPIDQGLTISINKQPRFIGTAGLLDNKKVIKIDGHIYN